jgi:hypothetical protein
MAITQVVSVRRGPEAAAATVGHRHPLALALASSMLARATTRMIMDAQ